MIPSGCSTGISKQSSIILTSIITYWMLPKIPHNTHLTGCWAHQSSSWEYHVQTYVYIYIYMYIYIYKHTYIYIYNPANWMLNSIIIPVVDRAGCFNQSSPAISETRWLWWLQRPTAWHRDLTERGARNRTSTSRRFRQSHPKRGGIKPRTGKKWGNWTSWLAVYRGKKLRFKRLIQKKISVFWHWKRM